MAEQQQTAVQTNTAEQILSQVKIPSLPEAAVKLLTLCRDELVGAGEIVRVVELDPALTARVLKIANSAAMGLQRRVNTLSRAAVVLGNENLKVVALGFHLTAGWRNFGSECFNIREFWRNSVVRACLARRIAQSVEYQPREEAFLAGMLQDLGTLVMGVHFGAGYVEAVQTCPADLAARTAMEEEQFGVNHCEIVKALAHSWNFPEQLTNALGQQSVQPTMMASKDASEVLWQIAYFCAAVPFSQDRQTAKLGEDMRNLAYSAFGMSMETLSDVFSDTVEQFNALHSVFAHLIPRDCQIDTIMSQARDMLESGDIEFNEETSKQ